MTQQKLVPYKPKRRPKAEPAVPPPVIDTEVSLLDLPEATLVHTASVVDASRNPVIVYLLSLDSEASRRTVRSALRRLLAALGSPLGAPRRRGEPEPRLLEAPEVIFPWHRMRYAEVVAARAALMKPVMAHGRGLDVAAPHVPSESAVNGSMSALKGVLREAFRLGLLTGEDWARIKDVGGVKADRLPAGRYIPADELARLFMACSRPATKGARGPAICVRDRALLGVLRCTGGRREEVCAIQLKDVDFNTGEAKVTGKGNKQRIVYLGAALDDVNAWMKVRGDEPGYLFWALASNGAWRKELSEEGLYGIVQTIRKRAGVKSLSPHDFRRTFITELLDLGVDPLTVQKLAGHGRLDTTMLYDRRDESSKREAVNLLKVPR